MPSHRSRRPVGVAQCAWAATERRDSLELRCRPWRWLRRGAAPLVWLVPAAKGASAALTSAGRQVDTLG